ncbi:MAG: YaiI/YqxD family protein [Pseudomonadota bacterium]
MKTLYVDADACPVKGEVLRVAARHPVAVVFVSDGGVRPVAQDRVSYVTVSQGADAADNYIAEHIGDGDLCVTNDIPLAARCVEAGAVVLRPDGSLLDAANIGAQLAKRDLMADLRSASPLGSGGGGRPFSKADRSRFLDQAERILRKL